MKTKSELRNRARKLVARHTQHGLDKQEAKKAQTISSLGTERNYVQGIANFLYWCDFNAISPNNFSNKNVQINFLEERCEWVSQKTLDLERQALQIIYRQKLPYLKVMKNSILDKRSYTYQQVKMIASHQTEKNAIMTWLGFYGGLRAHEAATILPIDERSPSSHRQWDPRRFIGFTNHHKYTVVGKGGLIREVAIPSWLSKLLESRRKPPTQVRDRGIYYISNFDVGFGQAWSQSFSSASKIALGFSTGGHGLRHSYSKSRLYNIIEALEATSRSESLKSINEEALGILSQELGHFRLQITFCYLR